MAYDPIVEGMFRTLGIEAPTYVDDLAGLLNGFVQAIHASLCLIWASWAAGLEVSTHTCRRLTCSEDSPGLRSACANLPVTTWLAEDGRRHVTGLPPVFLRSLMGQLWPEDGHDAQETNFECSCAFKTALVPKRRHEEWRAVMEATPFGGSAVRATWPYLPEGCCHIACRRRQTCRRRTSRCSDQRTRFRRPRSQQSGSDGRN